MEHRKTLKTTENPPKKPTSSQIQVFSVCFSVLRSWIYPNRKTQRKTNFPYGRGRESRAEAGTGHFTKSLKGLTIGLFRGFLFLPVPSILRLALLCEA